MKIKYFRLNLQFKILVVVIFQIIINCNTLPKKPETIPKNNYNYLNQYLESYIPLKMNEQSVVGLSLGIVTDKDEIYKEGFGYSDKANGKLVTPDTIFRIASISKILNLIATMKLVEEGRLNLDKPISYYLPELKLKTRFPNSKPITIRSILTHHSGIPSERLKGFFSHSKTDSLEKLVSQISNEYVSNPPEFIFSYSNLGHSLLGRILEIVSNDSYPNLLAKKVFQPLSMKSSFYEMNEEKKSEFSKGYGGIVFKSEVLEPAIRDLPAGFLNSSVNDLNKVIQLFLNGGKVGNIQFLKESTIKEIYKIQNVGNPYDADFKIGLGFFINTFDLGEEVFSLAHGGDTFLFHAMLGLLPNEKLGVIVLSNTNTSAQVVYQIAKSSLEISLETKTGYKKSNVLTKTEEDKSEEVDLSSYSGTYQNGSLLKVEAEKNYTTAKLASVVKFILPNKENEWQDGKLKLFGLFTIPAPIQFKFTTVQNHKLLFIKASGNILLWGSKINPLNSISEVWKKRLGKYKILNEDEKNTNMIKEPELKFENGFLVLETNGIPAANVNFKQSLALQILDEKNAIIAGLGRGKGDTISFVQKNNKEYLYYSGYEMELEL